MYLQYFGLREYPFSIAPDPKYLFLTEQHREALAHLVYGVGDYGGFILLTGEVGTGKTTVSRCLLEQMPENAEVAMILNPKQTSSEIIASLCRELGILQTDENHSSAVLVERLNAYLLGNYAAGRNTILIIDEAQQLAVDVLEQLRLLTNLETNDKKLLQLLLIGQPELNELLEQPALRQLSQRVTARYHLQPLGKADTTAYIQHRLAVAGCRHELFPPSAVSAIYNRTQGIPRLINLLCDRVLLALYAGEKVIADKAIVKKAAQEVFSSKKMVIHEKRPRRWGVLWVFLVIGLIALIPYLKYAQQGAEPGAAMGQGTASANENDSSANSWLNKAGDFFSYDSPEEAAAERPNHGINSAHAGEPQVTQPKSAEVSVEDKSFLENIRATVASWFLNKEDDAKAANVANDNVAFNAASSTSSSQSKRDLIAIAASRAPKKSDLGSSESLSRNTQNIPLSEEEAAAARRAVLAQQVDDQVNRDLDEAFGDPDRDAFDQPQIEEVVTDRALSTWAVAGKDKPAASLDDAIVDTADVAAFFNEVETPDSSAEQAQTNTGTKKVAVTAPPKPAASQKTTETPKSKIVDAQDADAAESSEGFFSRVSRFVSGLFESSETDSDADSLEPASDGKFAKRDPNTAAKVQPVVVPTEKQATKLAEKAADAAAKSLDIDKLNSKRSGVAQATHASTPAGLSFKASGAINESKPELNSDSSRQISYGKSSGEKPSQRWQEVAINNSNKDSAVQALFRLWKLPTQNTACDGKANGDLTCTARELSFDEFKQYNLPGVITLKADDKIVYGLLKRLDGDQVSIELRGEEVTMSQSELRSNWRKPSWIVSRLPREESLPLDGKNKDFNKAAQLLSDLYKSPINKTVSNTNNSLSVPVKADGYLFASIQLFDKPTQSPHRIDVNKVSGLVKRLQTEQLLPSSGKLDGVTLSHLLQRSYPDSPSLTPASKDS